MRRKEGASLARFLKVVATARGRGIDEANSRRVLDQATGLYWLPAFGSREEAEAFLTELVERWDERGWEPEETTGPVSEGPLGPIVFDVTFRVDEVMLSLDHRSQFLMERLFPDACPSVDFACLNIENWKRYRAAKGGIDRLARELAPLLTGVPLEALDRVGWVVHDQKPGQVVSSFRSQERAAA